MNSLPNYHGIDWHANEVPNDIAIYAIKQIDDIIFDLNSCKHAPCRELALVVTKLNEAQLWLTQISK